MASAPSPTRPRAGARGNKRHVKIEVSVRSVRWRKHPRAASVVKTAVLAAAKALSTSRAELAIVLCDDSAIRALNRKWRGKNAPTDVLSFPAPPAPGGKRAATPYIGDIVIAHQTAAREAAAEGTPFNHHLAHLAVHGFLHLLGYDHENDRDAERMEQTERTILKRIDIPDPYARRNAET